MPPALVRPYVRAIPVAFIPPAPPRRSVVPIRPPQPAYQPRHHRRLVRRHRPAPSLAWGVLLIVLGGASIAAGVSTPAHLATAGRKVAEWGDKRADSA